MKNEQDESVGIISEDLCDGINEEFYEAPITSKIRNYLYFEVESLKIPGEREKKYETKHF